LKFDISRVRVKMSNKEEFLKISENAYKQKDYKTAISAFQVI